MHYTESRLSRTHGYLLAFCRCPSLPIDRTLVLVDPTLSEEQQYILGLASEDRMIHALRETVADGKIPSTHFREVVQTILGQARIDELRGNILGSAIISERQRDIIRNLRETIVADQEFLVIDVGASDGWFLQHFLDPDFRGRLVCIEPIEDQFQKLLERAGEDPRVQCLRTAIGNRTADAVPLRVCHQETGLSSLLPFAADYHYFRPDFDQEQHHTETIACTTLDRLLEENPALAAYSHVALKIDTQGLEEAVLQGATGLLQSGRVKSVLIELVTRQKYAGSTTYRSILSSLQGFGFEIYDLLPFYREVDMEFQERPIGRLTEFDCLLVHQDVLCNERSDKQTQRRKSA